MGNLLVLGFADFHARIIPEYVLTGPRLRLLRRLERFQIGQWGDTKPVGDGVMEAREHFGPGWRMYYVVRGAEVVVMLAGGDKSSQETDIAKAREQAKRLRD
jgi:putative addiction module killer protein